MCISEDKPGGAASIVPKVSLVLGLQSLKTNWGSRLASYKKCFWCLVCIIEETLGEPASIVKHVCWCLVCIIEDKPGEPASIVQQKCFWCLVCIIEDKPGEPASIAQNVLLVPGLHH